MKTFTVRKLLPGCLVVTLALVACSKPVLDYRNAQFVDGKIYPSNAYPASGDSNKPFSGTVTNFPDNEVLAGNQAGMKAFLGLVISGTTQATGINNAQTQSPLVGFMLGATNAMCNVTVRDGLLDGHADCMVPHSNTPSTQLNFDQGNLDGDVTYFDASGNKLASGEFDDGTPSGTEKVYSRKTGQLIFKAHWGNNALDGKAAAYDPTTGALVYAAHFIDGKLDGTLTRYSRDGKHKILVKTFVQGVANGPVDTYDPATGAHITHGMEVNGQLNGQAEVWNAQGQLMHTYVYQNGNDVTPVSIQPVDCSTGDTSHRVLVETLICGNAELRKDDAQLAALYSRTVKSSSHAKESEDEQRDWIVHSRNPCTTVMCLEKAYQARTAYLTGPLQPSLQGISCTPEQERDYLNVRTICSNPALMADDGAMMAAYKAAFAASLGSGKRAIKGGINHWVVYVRMATCRDNVQCLDTAYRTLTAKLNAIAQHPDAPTPDLGSNTPMPGTPTAATPPLPAQPTAPSPVVAQKSSTAAESVEGIQASFDCAKAASSVEKMICSNQLLADYDVKMMQSYKAVMASSPDKAAIREAQRAWIAQRNACTTLDCVSRAYQLRIKQLNGGP